MVGEVMVTGLRDGAVGVGEGEEVEEGGGGGGEKSSRVHLLEAIHRHHESSGRPGERDLVSQGAL